MKRTSLMLAGLLATAAPASARITKTRPSVSSAGPTDVAPSVWAPLASFVIGGGVEYQVEDEQTEFAFPMLLEYAVSERLGIFIESEYASIDSKSEDVASVSGIGDLETAVDYEFVTERRYRPALGLEGLVRWPTAAAPDLGDPRRDYSLGLIASKDLVLAELAFNLSYTDIGDPEEDDEIEASLACEWHLNPDIDLIAEIASVSYTGGRQARETEATLGIGWNVNAHLVLEQGMVLKDSGEWAVLFGWEWDFGGD